MTARIAMTLERYLELGKRDHPARAGFACGFVGAPRSPTASEECGRAELRCSNCEAAAAVPLEQAVAEGWLVVTHEGRPLNDGVTP
jgi:hypothetical protein